MQPLGPGALGEILDDAGGETAGDAERVGELRSRSATPTPRDAPITPNTEVGWNPALCTALGTTVDSRQVASAPTAMPRSASAPARPNRSAAASTAGTTTAPACTGPPSKVSSKSSPCAAVPLISAASAAEKPGAWPIAVQGPSASAAPSIAAM
jgi:hypothetical protein